MKPSRCMRTFLQQIQTLPLAWINLSRVKRLLIVVISYIFGAVGLLVLFPLTHDGVSMYLSIISTCWLFRYRGLVASLLLNGIVFQLAYIFMLHSLLPDDAFICGAIIGFSSSLGLGLVICWLRMAVEIAHVSRQRASAAEQERMQALQAEREVTLAYEQQCKLNDLSDLFLLNISHELRTPLTVLGSSLELLKDYFEQLTPEERGRMLRHALASHDELVYLVSRVLDAVTVVGEFPFARYESVSIYKVVQEVLAYFNPQDIEAYTLHLHIDEQLQVWVDPQYLYRVLQNLLSNILKYVPTQTIICIEAVQPSPHSLVCLSVQDAGPGIPPEELPYLFEKLMRLKRDVAGKTRGTGLGLYICKQLIESMKGQIWVESSGCEGEGSRFCINLPALPLEDAICEDTKMQPTTRY